VVRKIIIVSVVFAVLAIIGVPLARLLVFRAIEKQIAVGVEAMKKRGTHINYYHLNLDWKRNIIQIDSLHVLDKIPNGCKENSIIAEAVTVKGIDLWDLVVRKRITVDNLLIDTLKVLYNHQRRVADTIPSQRKEDLYISISNTLINNIELVVQDSSCETTHQLKTSVSMTRPNLAILPGSPLLFQLERIALKRSTYINQDYEFNIRSAYWSDIDRKLHIDTTTVIPKLSRAAFSRRLKYQKDHYEAVIPYINLYGFKPYLQDTLAILAERATVQFYVKIFRDKNVRPDPNRKELPLQALRKLTVGINIPQLIVNKSYLSYDELPPGAKEPGTIFFDNIYATMKDLNNNPELKEGKVTFTAESAMMGKGHLRLQGSLPYHGSTGSVSGYIENMPLEVMNPMLSAAAGLRVESGHLNRLSFQMNFDEENIRGKTILNYRDLYLSVFKDTTQSKSDKREADGFMNFVINTFIVRRNMDARVEKEERTGDVNFKRDKTKSIFNYWWKGVLTGIKSAYRLDELEARRKRKVKNK